MPAVSTANETLEYIHLAKTELGFFPERINPSRGYVF
jgi:hypothetical protein